MTQQWIRKASVSLEPRKGEIVEAGALRFVFNITQAMVETPNTLELRVYNMAPSTMDRLKHEFLTVTIRAGYEGNYGIIFKGNTIKTTSGKDPVPKEIDLLDFVRSGRTNATDTFLDITAADGDRAYNWGTLNVTQAAGWTPNDIAKQVGTAYAPHGVTGGDLPTTVPQPPAPRGKVLWGMARAQAAVLARDYNLDWSIQNGTVSWIPQASYKEGEIVVLTSETGMIGLPKQTDSGLEVRCLLNPSIGIGQLIRVNQASIQRAAPSTSTAAINNNVGVAQQTRPSTKFDGFYKVLWVTHTGDNRGQPWYTDIVAQSIDPSVQESLAAKNTTSYSNPSGAAVVLDSPRGPQ